MPSNEFARVTLDDVGVGEAVFSILVILLWLALGSSPKCCQWILR